MLIITLRWLMSHFTTIPQVKLDLILCALFQEVTVLSPQTQTAYKLGKLSLMFYLISV